MQCLCKNLLTDSGEAVDALCTWRWWKILRKACGKRADALWIAVEDSRPKWWSEVGT